MMQIRLTVLGPRESGPASSPHAPVSAADVQVTAPVGTTLGVVAAALAGAVGARPGARGGRSATHVHLYAGEQRLDERALLGHPPLVDGAVLRLDEPDPGYAPPAADATALHVVGGPDAGGIHLLHPGRVLVGRSAEADVPLDDPDVSRFHLALQVGADGRVTVADTGSTNGTALDGALVGQEQRALPAGALLTLGESALRLVPGGAAAGPETVPDGQGQLQLTVRPALAVPLGRTSSGTGAVAPASPAAEGRGQLTARARGLLGRRRGAELASAVPHQSGPAVSGRWPDPAELLLTALGPGPRLWERGPEHPDALTVRLGTLAGRPLTVSLRESGSLGLAGPRARLLGLARAVVAQLAVLHAPGALELVLVSADPGRAADARVEDWAWLPWLPHLRPGHGQPCRLLTGFDPDQALARLDELLPNSPFRVTASAPTVVVVDGDPGSAPAREVLAALVAHGSSRGVHVLALAEHPDLLPHGLGATAAVTGDVATLLSVERPAPFGSPSASGHHRAAPEHELVDGVALDAVSAGWAGRLARALAPLREPDGQRRAGRGALPESARLLDVLNLGQVTPAQVADRWAEQAVPSGTGPQALVGVDRDGPCSLDLGGHLLIGGGPGSGRTELLRAMLASLAVTHRPDRLGLLLVEGRPPQDPARGLSPATELPHVVGRVAGEAESAAAAALTAELDRRAELLGERSFSAWHAERAISTRLAPPRLPADDYPQRAAVLAVAQSQLPHLVVAVDDWDAVRSPALLAALEAVAERGPRLGVRLVLTTARPESVAGSPVDEAMGVRVALQSPDARATALVLQAEDAAPWSSEEIPGRAWVRHPDGGVTAFQAARITGRIPRTATQRPTVTPLDWTTAGDPPTSRPLRELGNGPTDLALLASALQRAVDTSAVTPLPALF